MNTPYNTGNIIRFPNRISTSRRSKSGWPRHCVTCGKVDTLPYQSATIRSGREKLCVDCWIAGGMCL